LLLIIGLLLFPPKPAGKDTVYIRINQVGYLEQEVKTAVLFSNGPVREDFAVISAKSGREVYASRPVRSAAASTFTIPSISAG